MTYDTTQMMMTLSALAATSAVERPSGETVDHQEQRILAGINAQLAGATIAPEMSWQALWVGLTRNRANMAYIAQNNATTGGPQYAVCLRGTVVGSPIDTAEDMDVSVMLPFMAGATPPASVTNISQGAMQAFTDVIMGTALVQTLIGLVKSAGSPPTIYVTGHSLGGALATTVSLYLTTCGIEGSQIVPYTFAAPTAGDKNFAAGFDAQFPTAVCTFNQYDVVPNAWWNLVGSGPNDPPTPEAVEYFYPGMPGGLKGGELKDVIKKLVANINGKAAPGYTQPTQQPALNTDFSTQQPNASDITTLDDWLAEVAYQHANNTYLALLGAQQLPAVAPTVASIRPDGGSTAGFNLITLTGTNFTPRSVVDFGIVRGIVMAVSEDGTTMVVLSPAGVGIVDVTVTSELGTSPVVAGDRFTYALPIAS
jgi:hypothetical protein